MLVSPVIIEGNAAPAEEALLLTATPEDTAPRQR
jgi:hypothetical protein